MLLLIGVGPCLRAVHEARERARNRPGVFCMQRGFFHGISCTIEGLGSPAPEVERLIGERVNDWVATNSNGLEPSVERLGRGSPEQPFSIYLNLESPRLTPEMLGNLSEFPRHPNFSLSLSLDVSQFTSIGLAAIAELTNIDQLSLGPRVLGITPERKLPYCRISASDLAHLANLNALRAVTFSHVELTDDALSALHDMANLTELTLTDVRIGTAGLVKIGGLSQLQALHLLDLPIPSGGLSGVIRLSNLKMLSIGSSSVADDEMAHLSGLRTLVSLNFNCGAISDAALSHLEELSNLRELAISGNQVTDFGLAYLRQMPELDWLSLSSSRVTPQGIANLKRHLPNLRIRQ
ncbi:MAG: leucine-rich repeat domain-containing protein [Planctomycetales bacterium]